MDQKRAREIASLPEMINVSYQGTPIYIEYVKEKDGTAVVHPVGQHDDHMEVPLTHLIEHDHR